MALHFALSVQLSGCQSSGGTQPSAIAHSSSTRQEIVLTALSQIGTPYHYGGTSPSGFDCSGLVQYTFSNTNIKLPRSSLDQKVSARSISRNALQAGDLVFFKTGNSVYHVGIMIDDDKFVHAPSTGGKVRTDNLSARYWSRNFIGAGSYLH